MRKASRSRYFILYTWSPTAQFQELLPLSIKIETFPDSERSYTAISISFKRAIYTGKGYINIVKQDGEWKRTIGWKDSTVVSSGCSESYKFGTGMVCLYA